MKQRVLVIDDEPDICELLELTLERMDIDSCSAGTVAEAKALLEKHTFNLCLTDMRLPDGDGIELVHHLQAHFPLIPVAVITAHGNMDLAIETLKAGAFDFISKPVDLQHLRNMVRSALKLSASPDTEQDKETLAAAAQEKMMGQSAAMEKVRRLILKLARNQAPVFISGESGTGKELAARLIHDSGSRVDGPFIPVNCGAIPEQLMESEFFGHKKGSFTGAVTDKGGLFLAASGGTIFLDEIADLPLSMQVKLLRVIQEKTVRAIGAEKEVPIDVRILSASHKDLRRMVEEGSFRQDLFYRLNVIELSLPSLRDRREDIADLVKRLLAKMAARQGLPVPGIDPQVLQRLLEYSFPGNVRELENILERALAMSETPDITIDDLGLPAVTSAILSEAENIQPINDAASSASAKVANNMKSEHAETLSSATADVPPLEDYLEKTERDLITRVLEETHYNKTTAAKRLGISLNALRYRMRKLGLES